jgi:mono/diheme cytochrome c family protein
MTWLHRTERSLLRSLRLPRFWRFPLAGELIVTIVLGVFSAHGWAQSVATTAGERVYREGLLPSEATLWGQRQAGARIGGADAACVSCHRRSGLGSAEGSFTIPPIIGKYLFRTRAQNVQDLDLPHVPAGGAHREAYTDESLARAIRDGVRPDGTELSYLMPRFKIDDETMASLIGYLKSLTSESVAGVTEQTLDFATIVTPDADPVARQGMLDVLDRYFADKNAFIRGESPKLVSSREIMYRVTRRWQLHVWELTGPPATWQRQLHEHLAVEPVFAVVSGIGGKNWAPVHAFCKEESIPCLMPNVDLPVVAETDFYSIYFSKGVLLEAQLIAQQLPARAAGSRRLIQIFREGDIGEDAANAMRATQSVAGVDVVQVALKAGGTPRELANAVRSIGSGDAVILWLRPADLASLPATVPKGSTVFVSGLLGGLENAPLPANWRSIAHMTYPFDLPDQRKSRMNFPLSWFKMRNIPVVDERVQTDTYLACAILAETLGHMLDSFVRDYLVEREEVMLSYRLLNGYYPRLSLAPGQRFASKGGYTVHFAEPQGTRLVAEGGWVVP